MKYPHVDVTPETPEILAVAKWWADVLRAGSKFDNGDKSDQGFMASALASMSGGKVSDLVADTFQKQLAIDYAQYINDGKCWSPHNPDWNSYARSTALSVDYHPSSLLWDALKKSGFERDCDMIVFPWKTVMWCNPGKVEVRYGYGAPVETIYQQEPSNVTS